jgi:hypothetical protein
MAKSPCSVPDWLRVLLPLETPEQQEVCREHDADYAKGGSRVKRLRADLKFAVNMLNAKMSADDAERYLWGVRMYGGFHWNGGDWPGALPLQEPRREEAP